MEIAKQKDSVENEWSDVEKHHATLLPNSEEQRGTTTTINFVLLQSPLLASRDSDTVIVSRKSDFFRGSLSIIILFMLRGFRYQSVPAGNPLELSPLRGPRTYHARAEPPLLFAFPCR
jgi:hypothetical protein